MEEQEIDLIELWEAIKKRWIIVVIIPLIAALTSGIVNFFILDPIYEASTTLIVGKKASEEQQASQLLDNSVLQANKQLALTYSEIAKSRTVEENVINKLNLQYTKEELDKKITVESVKNTEILAISVQDKDPLLAAAIANTMAEKFSESVINIKKVDSVSIVDEAVSPNQPVKPKKTRNVLIAFAVGLIASVGLALLLEFLDNTIKNSKDVEKILGLPVLGEIPLYETDKA
ncbi:lipopolysaccharide biosynthesis protein [Desulfitobacterium hafniense]|uniref:Lipopolysaccharide biosynthesis protein n=1 Tax=Desulfitobacterium hafniense TaxID=49338 RepID=A0A0W1JQL2_DESHA|nr:Wzz/FepE/Etk N-terminal domain-containing protein [Desulfitobacterium hafniense]KTE93861.1 lipopolysaccharide biosynthesis protein [Desulfitobacterium hafniense]